MKTRYKNILFFGTAAIAVLFGLSFLLYDTINPAELALPHTEYGTIDYVSIGYDASKIDFENKISSRNIQYTQGDNFILLSGMIKESYPPHSSYCGYVMSKNMEDYWYSSSYSKDTLTSSQLYDENPHPCRPNLDSCHCSLEKILSEQSLSELSYLTPKEEEFVGRLVLDELKQNPNLNSDFQIGKYNFEYENDHDRIISFCGIFTEERQNRYFVGDIKNDSIIDFGLESNLPKLCTINGAAKIFNNG